MTPKTVAVMIANTATRTVLSIPAKNIRAKLSFDDTAIIDSPISKLALSDKKAKPERMSLACRFSKMF